MTLVKQLAATNQLLREAIQTPPPPEPVEPILRPSSRPATPVAGVSFLLAAHVYDGMNVLGDHFRDVPEDRVTRDGKDVSVACSCGSAIDLCFGQLLRCRCERFYFNGKTVKWAPAPEPHDCKPNENGWCDECGEDIELSSPTNPKEGS